MPSHIFIQRGMWDLVSSSNQSAFEAAVDLWEPGDSSGDMVHSLDWGQYGDLQRGDYERAALWIERMEEVRERVGEQPFVMAILPQVKARMAIEREAWNPQPVTDDSRPTELLATGLGAVQTGDLALAEEAAQRLAKKAEAARSDDADRSYYAQSGKPLDIMAKEVVGMLAIVQGETDAGLAMLADGVAIAESMRPPNGAPNPLKPIHELHGEGAAGGRQASAGVGSLRSLPAAHAEPPLVAARPCARTRRLGARHGSGRCLPASGRRLGQS